MLKDFNWSVRLFIENARVILPFSIGRLLGRKDPQFRIPDSEGIRGSVEVLRDTDMGPLLRIRFEGRYPPGSFGNKHAARMNEMTREAVDQFGPCGVLFDLENLNYTWGDSILGIYMALVDRKMREFRPSAIYAKGNTATALESLLVTGGGARFVNTGLFRDYQSALEDLDARLSRKGDEGLAE